CANTSGRVPFAEGVACGRSGGFRCWTASSRGLVLRSSALCCDECLAHGLPGCDCPASLVAVAMALAGEGVQLVVASNGYGECAAKDRSDHWRPATQRVGESDVR